jgi:hypothetical protein
MKLGRERERYRRPAMMALDWFLPKKERGAINRWNNSMKESI